MRIFYFVSSIFFLFCAPVSAQNLSVAEPLTLQECYQLALEQSETVAIRGEQIKEAEARFTQSLSTILPKVSFVYSERRQNGSNTNNFSLSQVPEAKFTFSQPLFSGFKEFAAMAGGKAETRQRKYEKRRAEELLFLDVVNAFYLLLAYQEEDGAMASIQQALLDRVEELKKREELGRSRPSEISSVEARLGRVQADLELIKSEGEVSRQLLEFLTGTTIDAIKDEGTPVEFIFQDEDISTKAHNRTDVLAAKEALEVSKKQVLVAQSGFWPTVTLDGNYYTKRVGNSQDIDWDVTLQAEVPIFQGGENWGKFKEAKSLQKQEELLYQQTERSAVLDIENALTHWRASVRRSQAIQRALTAAEKNYDLQKEDYQVNLVNNLDVLQALEETENLRRDFINIQSANKRNYWELKVAIGEVIQ